MKPKKGVSAICDRARYVEATGKVFKIGFDILQRTPIRMLEFCAHFEAGEFALSFDPVTSIYVLVDERDCE